MSGATDETAEISELIAEIREMLVDLAARLDRLEAEGTAP